MRRLLVLIGLCAVMVAAPAHAAGTQPTPLPPPSTDQTSAGTSSGAGSSAGTASTQSQVSTAPSPGSNGKNSWARPQIERVIAAGLMAPSIDVFRPNDPLTRGELVELLGALGMTVPLKGDAAKPVKLKDLDAALVRYLGVAQVAKTVRASLAAAGLSPKAYVGTEVVARLLGLRLNHAEGDDRREIGPLKAITRAETAYSVARVLDLRASRSAQALAEPAIDIEIPELTDWQRKVLTRAVRFVGYPYIWGGTSEKPQAPFGTPVPGGFDCSGLVWRVYKTEPYEGAPQLTTQIKGRTTYEMSGEMPVSERVRFGDLQPGDVVFFGDKGPSSSPSQIGHTGIALGGGWMIHSSSRGVAIVPMTGYYADRFAWGRRVLAEAGLS